MEMDEKLLGNTNKEKATLDISEQEILQAVDILGEELLQESDKESENLIENRVRRKVEEFKKYSEDFEDYRVYFKENKNSALNEEWGKKEEAFKKCSKKFNEDFDLFVKSLSEEIQNRKDYELELLVYLQLAQTKNVRVHNRLHKIIIRDTEDKIKNTEKNLKKQQENLKNVYTGFMTIIGVFLTIFTLVSVNLNFFGNILKFENSTEKLDLIKILAFFLLVNSVAIISIAALVLLLFTSIRYFNETKEFKEKRWLFIFTVPFLLMLVALILIA
ncbi:hypothetical protein A2U04_10730 [Fusobacterium necrophorum subsp. funduliforme]|uniref:hypothetical protein n=1 Tax=Fusobacterium necrophorum TaxID=859 RepID=UPI0007887C80|nr:hypothetical protein [Fusobacterium necrophorum]KYM51798.1 hypothetical protein A2U04_10730 [Fusobacterium necrophorum subsp. funduliforme]